MISRGEIEQKGLEFGVHVADVQRDYVLGWFLLAVYSSTALRNSLVLKGGNCLRKAYFPNTRFSVDIDFSTQDAIDQSFVMQEFNAACQFVSAQTGVAFDVDRNNIRVQGQLDEKRRVFDVRLYFKDFYGHADHISIRLSIDITEFDRIYLPSQARRVIHPYSDTDRCSGELRCLKLEEMVANKLKCLLQRRHVPDVYDLVYSVFINRDIEVDRGEVLSVFLQKTIYERSPGVARQLLLDLPLAALKGAWSKYIVAPIQGVLDFDDTLGRFHSIVDELFGTFEPTGRASFAFFPSHLRTPIMQAGADRKIVRMTYDGIRRDVEPYALAYKRRKDGHREEYFYGWDLTGGRTSGPGIKAFVNTKIQGLEISNEAFAPRYPIELAKAGEQSGRGYFSGTRFGSGHTATISRLRHGWRYTIECIYCSRQFKRMRRDTAMKPHKDGYGNQCYGRRGVIVGQDFV
jgi:predicted nucleotidyltransferase component of viral defense system